MANRLLQSASPRQILNGTLAGVLLGFVVLPWRVVAQSLACYSAEASTTVSLAGTLESSSPNVVVPVVPPPGNQNGLTYTQLDALAGFITSVNVFDSLGNTIPIYFYFYSSNTRAWTAHAYVDNTYVDSSPDPSGLPRLVGSGVMTFEPDGSRNNNPVPPSVEITMQIPWKSGAEAPASINVSSLDFVEAGQSSITSIAVDGKATSGTTSNSNNPSFLSSSYHYTVAGNVDGGLAEATYIPAVSVAGEASTSSTTFSELNVLPSYLLTVKVKDPNENLQDLLIYFFRTDTNQWSTRLYVDSSLVDPQSGNPGLPRFLGEVGLTFDTSGARTNTPQDEDLSIAIPWNFSSDATLLHFAFAPFSMLGDVSATCYISEDQCPDDDAKVLKGVCGCAQEIDSDGDGTFDCVDECTSDPLKIAPGACGCGTEDLDENQNGIADCNDVTPSPSSSPDGEDDDSDEFPSPPKNQAEVEEQLSLAKKMVETIQAGGKDAFTKEAIEQIKILLTQIRVAAKSLDMTKKQVAALKKARRASSKTAKSKSAKSQRGLKRTLRFIRKALKLFES